jgi:hypothetical protein
VAEVNLDGENAVSSLAFCSLNMTLAVGTTSGLVSSSCQMCGLVKIVTCL